MDHKLKTMKNDEQSGGNLEENSSGEKQVWWAPAVAMFMRLSVWVVGPVIVATFVGNWIDKKFNSSPWGLLSVVGVAFVFSMLGLVYEATKEYKKISGGKKADDKENNMK